MNIFNILLKVKIIYCWKLSYVWLFDTGVGSLSLALVHLPNPGIKPGSPVLQADSLPTELSGKPVKLNGICLLLVLLLLLLSRFSRVRLCSTPKTAVHRQPGGSPVPGIFQARTLEWVAISFSNAWKWKVKVKSLSSVWLFATPWLQPTRLLRPWDFPGKSTGVGCHCLLHLLVLVFIICVFYGMFTVKLSFQIYWYGFLHNIQFFSHLNSSFNEIYFTYHVIQPYIMYNSKFSVLFHFGNLLYSLWTTTVSFTTFVSPERIPVPIRCRFAVLPTNSSPAAAAAKSLQSCPTLCNPIDGSPPSSPVPGFSRQEQWSGLPFPSPMHESEKWKGSRSVVSDSSRPHGLQPTRLLHPWDSPGKTTGEPQS